MPRSGATSGGDVVLDIRTAGLVHDQVEPELVRRRIRIAGNKKARVAASERNAGLVQQLKRQQGQAD